MRVKKQKRHRKVVRFYTACFGFREPFKVLCDGTFIHHLHDHHLTPAADALSRLLGSRTLLFSSRCINAELKSLGESHLESFRASYQLVIARCDHEKRVSAAKCIEGIIAEGNPEHFFVATQDAELRKKIRERPGVPIIYGVKNSLFLDQPSAHEREYVKSSEEKRLHMSELELQMLHKSELKDKLPLQVAVDSPGEHDMLANEVGTMRAVTKITTARRLDMGEKSKFKRNKAKGPNPLSCKKKKTKESLSVRTNQDGRISDVTKRKRNRKRKRSQKAENHGDSHFLTG